MLLLHKGRVCFSGSSSELPAFLRVVLGGPLPRFANPSDFALDMLMDGEGAVAGEGVDVENPPPTPPACEHSIVSLTLW